MISKKLLLCGILGLASLYSTSIFAHSHHVHPRIKHAHHHHVRMLRNIHHWPVTRHYVEVRNRVNPRAHHHH